MDQDPQTTQPASETEIRRTFPFTVTRNETRDGDGLTLEGYAAVFDTPARINSWEGVFDEQVRRGAFKKTISESRPVLQFDHGYHPLVGSIPIGAIRKLAEDNEGLFVQARLSDNWLVEPVRDAIADGAIDGMSFRFEVVRDEWDHDPDIPMRTLTEIKLHELGPVVFPAYRETTVGVRSAEARRLVAMIRDADEPTRRDLAQLLTFPPNADDDSVTLGGDTDTPTPRHLSEARTRRIEQRVTRLRRLTHDFGGNAGQGSGDR